MPAVSAQASPRKRPHWQAAALFTEEAVRQEQLHQWLRAHGKPVPAKLLPKRAAQLEACFQVIDGVPCACHIRAASIEL